MARNVICLVWLAVLAIPGASGQTSRPDVPSVEDRDLVRLVLGLSSTERAGWSAEVPVLLDSTRPMREGPPMRGCLSPAVLDDLTLPATVALMTPGCARVDYRALRDSFVAQNIRTLPLGPSPMWFPTVSGAEARALSPDTRLDRFGGRRFVEVSVPAYSPDGRWALVYVQAHAAVDGFWASIRVFEHRGAQWTPTRC